MRQLTQEAFIKGKGPVSLKSNHRMSEDYAQQIAVQGLLHIASDAEALGKFLAITGLGPETLRAAAAEPQFLCSVLQHLMENESALIAFATNQGLAPEQITQAHAALAGVMGNG
jgi:Protein of unknown function (DUF3572)